MYKESHFLRLQDYIAEGSKGELTAEERDYEDALFATANVIRREGRQAAADWLMNDRGCTRHVARRMVTEAVNLFYGDDGITRTAWRNVLTQKTMDAVRTFERQFFADDDGDGPDYVPKAKDYEAYTKLIALAAKLQRVDEPEESPKGQQNFVRQVNVFTTDAAQLGMPATDRYAILQNPHLQQLPKRHQQRLAMEIGAVPMDIDQLLDNSVELAGEVDGAK